MKSSKTSKAQVKKLDARRPRGGIHATSGLRAGRFVIDGLDKACS